MTNHFPFGHGRHKQGRPLFARTGTGNWRLALLLSLAALFLWTGSLRWPVKRILLTATFGETRSDHFHNGIDLGCAREQAVHPVEDGEIMYYFDEGIHPLYQTFGNGNLVVMAHSNARRSYYYHLRKNSINTEKHYFNRHDILAVSGNTGRSFGGHLHLSIKESNVIINPLHRLGSIGDSTPPEIPAILFRSGNRLLTLKDGQTLQGLGSFEFMARAYDSYEKVKQLAVLGIYRIAFYIDGKKVRDYAFDNFTTRKNRLTMGTNSSFTNIYYRGKYYRGGVYKNIIGQHRFTVRAWDMAGNSRSKTLTLTLR